jgi:hypothetical protein
MKDALLQAGERLAEAMRAGLSAQGLPIELCLIVEDGRVVVASRSAALRKIEFGSMEAPPRGVVEGTARDASRHIVRLLAQDLEDVLK